MAHLTGLKPIAFFAMLLLCVIAIACNRTDATDRDGPKPVAIFLAFGSTPDPPEVDQGDISVTIGGGDLGGTVIVFVNEIPFTVCKNGGFMTQINEFIVEGKNEIRIEGTHSETIYLKVLTTTQQKYESTGKFNEVLGRTKISPLEKDKTLEFSCKLSWTPVDISPLAKEHAKQDELAAEISDTVKQIETAIKKNNSTALANQLTYGMHLFKESYGIAEDDAAMWKQGIANQFRRSRVTNSDMYKTRKVVSGKRGALVWCRINKFGDPVLWEISKKQKTSEFPALILVRHKGKLRVWNGSF